MKNIHFGITNGNISDRIYIKLQGRIEGKIEKAKIIYD